MNYSLIENYLIKFLRNEVLKTGLKGAIVGLSGGIDSCVVATLAQKAFGEKFIAIMMPSATSSQNSLDDACELCKNLNIKNSSVYIGDLVEVYFKNIEKTNLRVGNFSARMRMSILYDLSTQNSSLVLGTSNKSELLLGYGTIFGDLASAINPVGDLYKTEIFEFARYLNIPEQIIAKPPSADLWEGQSDEDELGFTYEKIDSALKEFVQNRINRDDLIKNGFDKKLVDLIVERVYTNQFKRKQPIIAKLRDRTIGHDFLYPRDIKL